MEVDNENQIVIKSSNRKCLFWDDSENGKRTLIFIRMNLKHCIVTVMSGHSRLNTGDVGEWAEENYLLWKGRKDDIVKVFGRCINSISDIENCNISYSEK